jgi:hypothetical protein
MDFVELVCFLPFTPLIIRKKHLPHGRKRKRKQCERETFCGNYSQAQSPQFRNKTNCAFSVWRDTREGGNLLRYNEGT